MERNELLITVVIVAGLSALILGISETALNALEKKSEIVTVTSPTRGVMLERYEISRDKETNKPIMDGKYNSYYPDGSFRIVGKYKKGLKVGKWKYFDEDGNKVKEEKFKKGKLKE